MSNILADTVKSGLKAWLSLNQVNLINVGIVCPILIISYIALIVALVSRVFDGVSHSRNAMQWLHWSKFLFKNVSLLDGCIIGAKLMEDRNAARCEIYFAVSAMAFVTSVFLGLTIAALLPWISVKYLNNQLGSDDLVLIISQSSLVWLVQAMWALGSSALFAACWHRYLIVLNALSSLNHCYRILTNSSAPHDSSNDSNETTKKFQVALFTGNEFRMIVSMLQLLEIDSSTLEYAKIQTIQEGYSLIDSLNLAIKEIRFLLNESSELDSHVRGNSGNRDIGGGSGGSSPRESGISNDIKQHKNVKENKQILCKEMIEKRFRTIRMRYIHQLSVWVFFWIFSVSMGLWTLRNTFTE